MYSVCRSVLIETWSARDVFWQIEWFNSTRRSFQFINFRFWPEEIAIFWCKPTHNECVAGVAVSPTASALFSIDQLAIPHIISNKFIIFLLFRIVFNKLWIFMKYKNNGIQSRWAFVGRTIWRTMAGSVLFSSEKWERRIWNGHSVRLCIVWSEGSCPVENAWILSNQFGLVTVRDSME